MTPKALHWLYIALGWSFTGLGIIGAFLPVMPTTPFLLVAVWAFSKSSPRFQHWLLNHPKYGPPLRDWHQYRAIRPGVKVVSVSAMAVSIFVVYSITVSVLMTTIHATVVTLVALYIVTRPSSGPIMPEVEIVEETPGDT
ncbi:MAG: YbaN family protein [Gammaproteobacteria bacterium]